MYKVLFHLAQVIPVSQQAQDLHTDSVWPERNTTLFTAINGNNNITISSQNDCWECPQEDLT